MKKTKQQLRAYLKTVPTNEQNEPTRPNYGTWVSNIKKTDTMKKEFRDFTKAEAQKVLKTMNEVDSVWPKTYTQSAATTRLRKHLESCINKKCKK